MNSRFVLAIAISAGMALFVTGLFYQFAMSGDSGNTAEVTMTEIVVAARDLDIGATVQITDLRMEAWPSLNVPTGSFATMDEVVERVPVNQILAEEPVLARRLSPPGSGIGLSPKVPDGMRAMSIRVDEINGVGGFVFPEARVDVLITGSPMSSPEAGQMTKTILGNVRVLSAGELLTPDPSGKPQKVPVVTLLLTPQQAEMVTLAQTQGRLQLVLRNSQDSEVAETTGVREAELFGSVARTINVSRPAPAPVLAAPPPPPPIEIEVIRGNERSVASFAPSD